MNATLKVPSEDMGGLSTRGMVALASLVTTYNVDSYTNETSLQDAYDELSCLGAAASAGDFESYEKLLGAQAFALNTIFAGLAHRSKVNARAGNLDASETYLRIALRAQAHCRQTVQTLFEMKNPQSVAFVKQANIAHGPQQVNNGAPTDAREVNPEPVQTKQLEANDGERLDIGTSRTAIGADPHLEALGALDGAANGSRQGSRGKERNGVSRRTVATDPADVPGSKRTVSRASGKPRAALGGSGAMKESRTALLGNLNEGN